MPQSRPGANPAAAQALLTPRTPRVVAVRKLHRRRDREAARRFLVEGPQAVREALAVPGLVRALFGTPEAIRRYRELAGAAPEVWPVTGDALAGLADTVHPQGLVAVCDFLDVPLSRVTAAAPGLVAVLAEIRDPGNAGTVLRTADAAGAGAVVFAGDAVDPYNGKCVRASVGSLFHLDVVRGAAPRDAIEALRAAGLQILAADAHGEVDLDEYADAGALRARTAWVFGSEAHGLAPDLAAAADVRVRVPIHGRAESLNLAAAAAVCLYSSARAQRSPGASS
jgi:TrmH family RNA methyltransferase